VVIITLCIFIQSRLHKLILSKESVNYPSMMPLFVDIAVRSAVVYLAIIVGLRLLGKKHMAQLSIPDFVLVLLISNAVQNAMVGNDTSLTGGLIAAATLIVVNYLLSWLLYRFRKSDKVFEGTPTLLIHNGQMINEHLAQEKITVDELEGIIREHGLEDSSKVKNAVMEVDGTISVIPKDSQEHRIEIFKHRKQKFQQKKP
jgi:uncharacterized membrane protein YcaP (DUF421 family)